MAPQEVFQGIIILDSFQSEVNSLYLQNVCMKSTTKVRNQNNALRAR